jgi:hypothetical protein
MFGNARLRSCLHSEADLMKLLGLSDRQSPAAAPGGSNTRRKKKGNTAPSSAPRAIPEGSLRGEASLTQMLNISVGQPLPVPVPPPQREGKNYYRKKKSYTTPSSSVKK